MKFDNSLIKDTEKRMLLSYVLEEHPLNADTLNTSWNSLLIRKSIKANTGIRLSTIDLLKQTSVVCSPDSIKILEGDSLLSRYLGMLFFMFRTNCFLRIHFLPSFLIL